jgi:hypothetical protein
MYRACVVRLLCDAPATAACSPTRLQVLPLYPAQPDAVLFPLQTFWQETIDAINLTDEQTDKILYLASMLVKSIKSCHSHREVLSRKLTSILPQTYGTSGDVGAAVAAVDAMSELRKCVLNTSCVSRLPDSLNPAPESACMRWVLGMVTAARQCRLPRLLMSCVVAEVPCPHHRSSHITAAPTSPQPAAHFCVCRRNFQSEHIAWTTFVAGVMANVLTCQQFARLCSRSYPYFPRTCASTPIHVEQASVFNMPPPVLPLTSWLPIVPPPVPPDASRLTWPCSSALPSGLSRAAPIVLEHRPHSVLVHARRHAHERTHLHSLALVRCRFQIAAQLAKGKDILELTGLPIILEGSGDKPSSSLATEAGHAGHCDEQPRKTPRKRTFKSGTANSP